MSRTEGILLPRLPTTHTRVTSPGSIQPTNRRPLEKRARSFSEPHHTAYIGTPRQDVPRSVYFNAVEFDDVFDKEGKLLGSRNTPKITCPLNALEYNSLNDPHCRRLFLNNGRLREHLMSLGLITSDLKVVATTKEQRQKIRAHELLERKEQLLQKMERREQERLQKLQKNPVELPSLYAQSLSNAEIRRLFQSQIGDIKLQKALDADEERKKEERKKLNEEKKKLKAVIEEFQLAEQAKRNAAVAEQEMAELAAYEEQYGKYGHLVARWHRDSDIIHNRMTVLEHTKWARMRRHTAPEESQAPPFHNPPPATRPGATAAGGLALPVTPPASPISSLPLLGNTTSNAGKSADHLRRKDMMATTTGRPLENRAQLDEVELCNQTHVPNHTEQKTTTEAMQNVLRSDLLAADHHHGDDLRSDLLAADHHHGDDLTPSQQPYSVAEPTQMPPTGLGTASEGEEPDSQFVPPLRSGRLSVIEEASESGERPESILERPEGVEKSPGGAQDSPGGVQESPGGAQESPGGAQESPGGAQESPEHDQTRAEGHMDRGRQVEGEEAWVETKPLSGVSAEREEPPPVERVMLDRDQSMEEMTRILTEALEQAGVDHEGFVSNSDFGQVLGSHSLGLDLDHNEIAYITEEMDVYKNGWIPFTQVVPYLPDMLMTIYAHRAELEMQQFGAYTEEQWCQIVSPSYGELFLSKINGTMQNWRPENFRPFLKDDVFEDSIMQYFHQADTNGDGEVDDDEFRNFLVSPEISQSIYQSQMQELYEFSHSYSADGRMSLEIFAAVARSLILMIYQNTYPSEDEWIRIQSRKPGDFSLNKRTGEVVLADPSLHPTTSELMASYAPTATSLERETEATPTLSQRKSGKKTKKQRKKASGGSPGMNESAAGEGVGLTSPPPPLLRRRTPRVNESSASVDGQSKIEVDGQSKMEVDGQSKMETTLNEMDTAPPPDVTIQPDVQMSQVSTTFDRAEDLVSEVGDVPATSNDNVQNLVLPRISEEMNEIGASQVPPTSDNVDGLATHPQPAPEDKIATGDTDSV